MAEKIPANRGDLFEAFFACAVAARFVKRVKIKSSKSLPPISNSDVESILTEVMKNGYQKNVNDVGSAVVDTVTVNISIPKKAKDFLLDRNNWRKVSDLIDGAVRFANSHSRLATQSRGLSINERQDIIKVIAAGTEDQRGTKADVKVEVDSPLNPDRRYRNIDYSLKVSGGEQFHQVSGQGFDKFLNIFGEMGLDVSSVSNEYQTFIDNFFDKEIFTKKYSSREQAKSSGGGEYLKKAARLVYAYAAKELNNGLNTDEPTEVKTKFADYIIYGLSRNVNTELVKFVGANNVKTIMVNRNLRDIIANSKFSVKINNSGDPKIEIYLVDSADEKLKLKKNNLVLQIRYKMEVASNSQKTEYKFYPRNYLEAQPGMFSF